MNLLAIQFVDPRLYEPIPVFSHSLGVLAAMLKAEGANCSLLTLAGFRPEPLKQAVVQHRPDFVLVKLDPYSVAASHRTIAEIQSAYSLPVLACGAYATCRPSKAASIPGVTALVLGEYESSAAEVLRAWGRGGDAAGIAGTWGPTDSGLVKGKLPDLVEDLDSLPMPDRELFDYARVVKTTREARFKVARGCPLWCAYCFNDWYMDLYEQKGAFVRRRSVGNVLAEVEAVLNAYDGAESTVFYDHCFAMDTGWLEQFAAEYPRRCKLPYRCHVRLGSVSTQVAQLLAESNCRWVHTHIGSGSRFIREEILSMHLSSEKIVQGIRLLRDAGLRVSAEVFVGAPYESEITVEETLQLLRKAKPNEVHPRVFYPIAGTRAAELCKENEWTSSRGEENYWRRQSVLDIPSMPADYIEAIVRKFPSLLRKRKPSGVRRLLGKLRPTQRRTGRDVRTGRGR